MYWLTAASHRDALLSSSSGGTRMDWWPEYTLKYTIKEESERKIKVWNKAYSKKDTQFRLHYLPAQAPEGKAQATVRVQTEGNLSGGVELTLEFYGATQGTGGGMRHLEETTQHNTHRDHLTPCSEFPWACGTIHAADWCMYACHLLDNQTDWYGCCGHQ